MERLRKFVGKASTGDSGPARQREQSKSNSDRDGGASQSCQSKETADKPDCQVTGVDGGSNDDDGGVLPGAVSGFSAASPAAGSAATKAAAPAAGESAGERPTPASSPGKDASASARAAAENGKGRTSANHKAAPAPARRLMKEYQELAKRGPESDITCQLVDDNLREWDVFLRQIDPDSTLHRDMAAAGVSQIELRISFPERYPFVPPFMRVTKPYISGGYVMEGGAICMELLTSDGWSGAYTAEAIVRQFAASLVQGKARLAKAGKGKVPYSQVNAEHSFQMVVKVHQNRGWFTPPKDRG